MDQEVTKIYGNRVRVRACGICWADGGLLLVNHKSLTDTIFWAPPGGGVNFGMSIEKTLKKEFAEETGLEITPGKFLFGCEFIHSPLHAIELFYDVKINSGNVRTGTDPELQIIREVRFMDGEEIMKLPKSELHGIFRFVNSPSEIIHLEGFFRI
jgi:8-oxo-dGTP diphosphatase